MQENVPAPVAIQHFVAIHVIARCLLFTTLIANWFGLLPQESRHTTFVAALSILAIDFVGLIIFTGLIMKRGSTHEPWFITNTLATVTASIEFFFTLQTWALLWYTLDRMRFDAGYGDRLVARAGAYGTATVRAVKLHVGAMNFRRQSAPLSEPP